MRHRVPRTLTIPLMVLAACACDSDSTGHAPAAARPNFVVILADDLDWKVTSRILETGGALGKLADDGMTFRRFFVSTANCCPSRVTFLRGQYAHNHGIVTSSQPPGGFRQFRASGQENSTLATWLQNAGYRTVLIGKYANGYPDGDPSYVPPGWDEWYATLSGNHYYDFLVSENGTLVRYECCDAYETDIQSMRAVDFVRRAAADSVPFLLYLAPFAPHAEAIPAARHQGAFAGETYPRVPSLNEKDVSDKPSFIAALPLLSDEQIANYDRLYRQRLATMLAVDEMVDSIANALQQTGQRANTYMFFSSDNGWHNGEHRLGRGKVTPYDEDIRVPLIVAGPTVPSGIRNRQMVLNTDLAPTIAELAGVTPPDFVDGRSFVPLFNRLSFSAERRKRFLIEWSRPNPTVPQQQDKYWDHAYRAVRSANYLYVEWDNGEVELYARSLDPYELENIAATAGSDLLTKLSSWVDQLSSCFGMGCLEAEGW